MIKNILFDLDGTLLPMDQDKFANGYFSRLIKKLAPLGYDPKKTVDGIWAGTAAMVKNNGQITNEQAFWLKFKEFFGEMALKDKPVFDEYYRVEFKEVKSDCGFNPAAAETVKKLKERGFKLILATNPIFPAVATESRIEWAGLDKSDFALYTTYENSHYCKPNPEYYREITEKLCLDPAECLMVGNDAEEDTAAEKLGIKVFLLTDCLINKKERDITAYPRGSFEELLKYTEGLN
ncbi:MAG: HAD family hydrolase [Acutalibacteraceae bacterium]